VAHRHVDSGSMPNCQVMVSRCGKVVFFDTYGHADVEAGTPLRDDAIFRLASMTKPVTCVAAMICYERGCFQMGDALASYLPEWKDTQVLIGGNADKPELVAQQTPIIIKQLFMHTAGLAPLGPSQAGKMGFRLKRDKKPKDLKELCEVLAATPLSAQPGERWQYGACHTVLGRLVEVWSGQTLDVFMQQNIFGPLGMIDTCFELPETKLPRVVASYRFAGKHKMERFQNDRVAVAKPPGLSSGKRRVFDGSGGLVGTCADYFRFAQMLCDGGLGLTGARILGPRSVEHMATNHLPGGGDLDPYAGKTFTETGMKGIGFGLGMAVVVDPAATNQLSNRGEFYWGGVYSTMFYVDPRERIVVVCLSQLLPSTSYPIRPQMRIAVNQAIVTDAPPLVPQVVRSRL